MGNHCSGPDDVFDFFRANIEPQLPAGNEFSLGGHSLGTLTFIKSVVKRIRNRMMESSILQIPMEDCAGKLSYPLNIKHDLFSTVYQAFHAPWQENVFFYMCMEHVDFWEPVLGRSYQSNEQFEEDMLRRYHEKVREISS